MSRHMFHVKRQPHPAASRGETIHFNPYRLHLNYPTVFHVKPLPHCAPTKPTFHVKHHTPLYDAHSNPPRFTWNMENLVQTSRNITLTSHDCQATQPTLWGTGEHETGWQTLSQFSAYLYAPHSSLEISRMEAYSTSPNMT